MILYAQKFIFNIGLMAQKFKMSVIALLSEAEETLLTENGEELERE